MTTSAAPKHFVANSRTTSAAAALCAVLAVWVAAIFATRGSAAMQIELPELARNLSAGLFLIAGSARLVCWRIAQDWAAGRVAIMLLALGTALPAGSILAYGLGDSAVARIEAPEARMLYVVPLIVLALVVSMRNRRRFLSACAVMLASGAGSAVALIAFADHNTTGERFTGLWIAIEAAAAAGWVGLAFHAWTRRRSAPDRSVLDWAIAAMSLMAACELVKAAALAGSDALQGVSAGLQLCAAVVITANAVRMLVTQLRQRVLDDQVGHMLLHRRGDIEAIEQAQRERLHDARSAMFAVKGASTLLTTSSARSQETTATLTSMLSSELDRLQSLLDTSPPTPCSDFDLRVALLPVVTAHRLAGARITESVPALTASGRPLVTATAVDNLLGNAARHAPSAEVLVSARLREDGQVEIVVEDDGPGIPADQRERVLLPGVRGTSARGTGSGLGLHNSVRAMAEQQGSLRIEDRRHGGTRVVLTLPGRAPVSDTVYALVG